MYHIANWTDLLDLFALMGHMYGECTCLFDSSSVTLLAPLLHSETLGGIWKPLEIPTGHVSPHAFRHQGMILYIYTKPVIKGWCQSIAGHVLYPTDSLSATRLGLCISMKCLFSPSLHYFYSVRNKLIPRVLKNSIDDLRLNGLPLLRPFC